MNRKHAFSAIAVLLLSAAFGARAATLDYTHWAEGGVVMLLWDLFHEEANVITLGESSSAGIDQFAILIASDADVQDGAEKNVVLFECAMHAREWYAAQSCFWLADYLLDHRRDAVIQELLDHADIWIIPHTNPAGRDRDDLGLGDPTAYTWFCDDGSNAGGSCATDGDCPGGSCYDTGWRGNANTSLCYGGVDLARNWSSGWDSAFSNCFSGDFLTYRGPAPFSEPESRNLRRFVHNRMISMAAVVHSNTQKVGHHWNGISTAATQVQDLLWGIHSASLASWGDPVPGLAESVTGNGSGQFSGWLTGTSNVAGELDDGTQRNIPVVFFELPMLSSFYGPPYQEATGDGSNGFHPSGDDMQAFYDATLRDVFLEVIRQARSPACPIDGAGNRDTAHCPANDFGLVGAKIADDVASVGVLDIDPDAREETAPAGTHDVVFAVQNFSAGAGSASTQVTVTIERDGVVEATHILPISLAGGDRAVFTVSHAFSAFLASSDYFVTIALDGDDLSINNVKSFAFRVDPLFILLPLPIPGIAVFEIVAERPFRFSFTGTYEVPFDPSILDPLPGGVDLILIPHPPGPPEPPEPLRFHLDDDSWQPASGGWRYRSSQGPIGEVRIRNLPPSQDLPARTVVEVLASGSWVAGLRGASSITVDLAFPEPKVGLRAAGPNPAFTFLAPVRGEPSPADDEHEPPATPGASLR